MPFGIHMACGRCHTETRECSTGFITTFIRVYIQNKSLQSNSWERRAHSEGPYMQTHNSISQNSSTQKATQSPPQLQFLDLQPFLRKAGYKRAAPDSLWRLNSANAALPLPVLLHPHQPFPLPSAFKPLGKSSFSTTNTTPKLLRTHTQQMLLDRVIQYWKSLHPPADSLTSPHISLKESKATTLFQEEASTRSISSAAREKYQYLLRTWGVDKTRNILHGYRGKKTQTNRICWHLVCLCFS